MGFGLVGAVFRVWAKQVKLTTKSTEKSLNAKTRRTQKLRTGEKQVLRLRVPLVRHTSLRMTNFWRVRTGYF